MPVLSPILFWCYCAFFALTTEIKIPTPGRVIEIQADVVKADVSFFLGLDTMDRHRVQALKVIEFKSGGNSLARA